MKEVEQEMPGALDVSSRKSVVLDRWLNDPRVEIHIGRNYWLEMKGLRREERLKEEEG